MTDVLLAKAVKLLRRVPRTQDSTLPVKVYLLLETGGGGSGRHVLDLYAGLLAAGWDVYLLLSTTRMDAAFAAEVAALPIERVTLLKLRRSPHISDLAELARIRRLLKIGGGACILHAHSTKAAMLAWALRGSPLCRIFTPHAYRGMDPKLTGYRGKVVRGAEKVFSRPFESVIAVSQEEVSYTASLGVQAERIHFIANGVDVGSIRQAAGMGLSKRSGTSKVLGFLGRLVEQKNPKLFLAVLNELVRRGEDVYAIVVGDGPLLSELRQMAGVLGIAERVQWLGMVPGLPHLPDMDVLVHTSAYESLPYSLLEAIAVNVPVIAVRNAGSLALFERSFPRCIVPEGTAEAMADAVSAVLSSEQLRQECSERYLEIAEQFSTQSMVSSTIAVYQEALRLKSQSGARFPFPKLLPRFTSPFPLVPKGSQR